jgi:predicted transcriptional regulator
MKANASLATAENPISITTNRQEKAIIALLNQPTMKEAAEAAGISEVTLWRWLQTPDFRSSYMEARRVAVQRAIARTQAATTEAVETLREVMNDQTAKGSERIAAAKAILDYALKGIELEDHEMRLQELEARLAGQSG